MENNIERLNIKDIAPYLPYGLKGSFDTLPKGNLFTVIGFEIEDNEGVEDIYIKGIPGPHGGHNGLIETFTPRLRNISCLTKTIQHEGTEFCPIVELAKIAFADKDWELHWKKTHAVLGAKINFAYDAGIKAFVATEYPVIPNQYALFQKIAEWHINFVGISEGLYIDKNTLK